MPGTRCFFKPEFAQLHRSIRLAQAQYLLSGRVGTRKAELDRIRSMLESLKNVKFLPEARKVVHETMSYNSDRWPRPNGKIARGKRGGI